MRFRITQGINPQNGDVLFRVYELVGEEWRYRIGLFSAEECHKYIERRANPKEEVVWEGEV